MPISLTVLSQRVYRRLNEPNNTDIAVLQSGTSTTPTITAINGVIDFYVEVVGEICRTCFPIFGKATYASVPVGTKFVSFSSFTVNTSGLATMWIATEAQYGGTSLQYVGFLPLSEWLSYSGGILSQANGSLTQFCNDGDAGQIILSAPPSSSADMVVGGLCIPTPPTSGSDSTTAFMPDDLLEIIEVRICSLLAKKRANDPTMANKIDIWDNLYNARRMELWSRLLTSFRQIAYPMSPTGQMTEGGS